MEAEGVLDHLNEVDIYCLHYVFIPAINVSLKPFQEAWNNHSVATENQQTPCQMFARGLLQQVQDNELESDSGSDSDKSNISLNLAYSCRLYGIQSSLEQVDRVSNLASDVKVMVGVGKRPRGSIAEAPVTKIRMSLHVKDAAPFSHFLSRVQKLCIIASSTVLLFEPSSEKQGTKRNSITSAVSPRDFVALKSFSTAVGCRSIN